MTRTISARINNETHEKLVNICNELGQTMNELLNEWIKNQVHAHPDPHRKEVTIENI